MHPVMAMALGVSGNRLRLRTPAHSGGSFGVKHAVFLTLGATPAFSVTIPRRPRGTVAAPV
jgi:hypothetical protein